MCVDYQQLNNITIKNNYLIPLLTKPMDWFQKAKWFMKFDISECLTEFKSSMEMNEKPLSKHNLDTMSIWFYYLDWPMDLQHGKHISTMFFGSF